MDQDMCEAIVRGDHNAIRRASSKRDVNEVNSDGYTPLYYACMKKGVGASTVEEILLLGVNVEEKGADGETPLYIACFNGKVDVVLLLLDRGADVNAVNGNENETALHAVARAGNCTLIELLAARGADVNAQNIRKETPIYIAARLGLHNAVYHLLKAHAEPGICDMDGKSPLYVASERNLRHVVILLKEKHKDLAIAKASADRELRLRPPPIKSTEEIFNEAVEDAAAGRVFQRGGLPPNPERELKPLDIVEIVAPCPKSGPRNPFAAISEGPCRSLEEVGYDEPNAIPPEFQKRLQVKPQRIGGTSMRCGTSVDVTGVEPVRINSILGDAMEFAVPEYR